MSNAVTVSAEEVLQYVKLTCQIPTIVEGILAQKCIATTAEAKGIQVTPEELQQAADGLRLMNRLRRSDETYTWLQKHALSVDEFEAIAHHSVMGNKLAYELFADKVEPFFVEHQLDYVKVNLYEVVLEDADLAMELFYALKEEEISFFEIAQQYIQDPELRRVGGFRGGLRRADLKPEVSPAVFAASPPQLLQPIVTAKGVHLILVESLIQPELDMKLKAQILSELFSNWIKQQVQQVEAITVL
jgi:hypothetical protein